ncbi:MarR family transcriptional regulator [Bombiscardovia apis]|uniref:MarR family transcriptional regulator n=1 Tax=Bombiscardovia apis TaxID=2932182 RepID=A0ABM8BCZ7_9BIFI|nr:MarR family winged helix-turn-helix transcriptional regulator [Bombiscardovia apis]BDR54767.1 MarR family transcriptional regulator [Bombiscardovia apis]
MAKQQQYHWLSGYIASIYRQSKSEFKKQLALPGFKGTQSDVMMFLYDHKGLCQRQIAAQMGVDPSLLARDIKTLLEHKLVVSQINPNDKRANVIALSQQGEELAKRQIRAINTWWSHFFEQEPEVDPAAVLQTLAALNRHLKVQISANAQ